MQCYQYDIREMILLIEVNSALIVVFEFCVNVSSAVLCWKS